MNDNYRNRLESYLASMLQAKRMLSMGIITPEDYVDIDTIMNEKYGISSCIQAICSYRKPFVKIISPRKG